MQKLQTDLEIPKSEIGKRPRKVQWRRELNILAGSDCKSALYCCTKKIILALTISSRGTALVSAQWEAPAPTFKYSSRAEIAAIVPDKLFTTEAAAFANLHAIYQHCRTNCIYYCLRYDV